MDEVFDKKYQYVEARYKNAIGYYWKASRTNKRGYKYTRGLTVILGALVTLTASVASSNYLSGDVGIFAQLFAILTPFLAASLTIIAGFSQSFQWGATWKDMVMTAQLLEKERDRFLVTEPEEQDFVKELDILNSFVLTESMNFFDRLIGGATRPNEDIPEAGLPAGNTAVDAASKVDDS